MSYQQNIQQIKHPVMLPGCERCPAKCEEGGQIHETMKQKMKTEGFNMEAFLKDQDQQHKCTAHCGNDWMTEAMEWPKK